MRSDVTVDDLSRLVLARVQLYIWQAKLQEARVAGHRTEAALLEKAVCAGLDRLWEAQQRAS